MHSLSCVFGHLLMFYVFWLCKFVCTVHIYWYLIIFIFDMFFFIWLVYITLWSKKKLFLYNNCIEIWNMTLFERKYKFITSLLLWDWFKWYCVTFCLLKKSFIFNYCNIRSDFHIYLTVCTRRTFRKGLQQMNTRKTRNCPWEFNYCAMQTSTGN